MLLNAVLVASTATLAKTFHVMLLAGNENRGKQALTHLQVKNLGQTRQIQMATAEQDV
jgi:hypothetical protein